MKYLIVALFLSLPVIACRQEAPRFYPMFQTDLRSPLQRHSRKENANVRHVTVRDKHHCPSGYAWTVRLGDVEDQGACLEDGVKLSTNCIVVRERRTDIAWWSCSHPRHRR